LFGRDAHLVPAGVRAIEHCLDGALGVDLIDDGTTDVLAARRIVSRGAAVDLCDQLLGE